MMMMEKREPKKHERSEEGGQGGPRTEDPSNGKMKMMEKREAKKQSDETVKNEGSGGIGI